MTETNNMEMRSLATPHNRHRSLRFFVPWRFAFKTLLMAALIISIDVISAECQDSTGVPSKPGSRFFRRPATQPARAFGAAKRAANSNAVKKSGQPNAATPLDAKSSEMSIETKSLLNNAPSAIVAAKPILPDSPSLSLEGSELKRDLTPITVATDSEKDQKIAEDWAKPWACLVLTGRQHGYIEPCGCTGLENQKGGLNRRDTLLKMLRDRDWTVIPIDAGDQVRRFGRQSELKFAKTVEALKLMDYQAVTFGQEELKLSAIELLSSLLEDGDQKNKRFIGANFQILLPETIAPYRVIEVGNKKIGIVGVLGKENSEEIKSNDLTVTDPVEALQAVAPKLEESKCDFRILIAHASLEESQSLARAVPVFDLVVTAGGYGEPYYKPEPIPGTPSVMVQVGVKGMYAGIVGLFDDPKKPLVYQRVALSSQFEDSPRIMELFGQYQSLLQQTGLDGLGLRPLSHPSTREFVGTKTCAECHSSAFEVWKNTPHAHATDSIISPPGRGQVPRHFDPECLSCHVTGWNPQGFNPYVSGYLSLTETPELVANGCENCHGPGKTHAQAESGEFVANADLLNKLREELRLPIERAQEKCMECHDIDNSPGFYKEGAFEEYWEKVKHVGKD